MKILQVFNSIFGFTQGDASAVKTASWPPWVNLADALEGRIGSGRRMTRREQPDGFELEVCRFDCNMQNRFYWEKHLQIRLDKDNWNNNKEKACGNNIKVKTLIIETGAKEKVD